MRTPCLLLALLVPFASVTAAGIDANATGPSSAEAPVGWPEITRENKPWTRWWWPGSAVDQAGLTAQMEKLAAAGLGGMEITPIYGARGYEERTVEFLTPKWMQMLEHVGREGQRLGLGVDMATGTGWPFGGPWIDPAHALQRAALKDGQLAGESTRMMVKRAAPGDEGLVVDPYSAEALQRYLAPFGKVFASFPRGLVRGQFHDSFEYFAASWTPKLPEVFRAMHGYDVNQFASELLARNAAEVRTVDRETLARIKSDYRETLAQLHLEYLRTWVAWSHERGFIVRNQSHGAPANLLDLYANADVAETEIFGSTPFPIPGMRRNPDEVRHDQDLPESLVVRMASSAGHVVGHNLSSSESATWLRDHWKVSLAHVKPELDRIFADGINHVFYHGTVYSPPDVPWPGWLFYAATQFNPNNTWWDDFSALNHYVARIQSVLQRGKPDNDILLYWPLADVWENADGLMKMLGVHDVKWLTEQPVGKIARALMERGYSFDYVSDAQLGATRVERGELATAGARYKVLVVPAARRMPVGTIRKIAALAQGGATVIFEKLPEDVPGYGRLERRRAEFKQALAGLGSRAMVQTDISAALATKTVPRESIAEAGINFIRRGTASGADYFFANLTGAPFNGWATLGVSARVAAILDPLTGASGAAAQRQGTGGKIQVYLQLAPGESLIVRTSRTAAPPRSPWPYRETAGPAVPLGGKWTITFAKGGPELPPELQTTELKSWTDLGGDEAQRFGGTATYRIEFDAPVMRADDWLLDLGDVRESARVTVNGRDVTTAWSIPFRVRVGEFLKPGRNVLELAVTNLAANRIRDLDQRKVPWKIMREINFVNINYKPFDASNWPLTPSGLLGPVTLTPLRKLRP
ncbi:MAG: glycosyl hydrolase [Opitutaceae bacterium]|nr:glycosyl hydrolase [Opitutaceae bacterium]